jgi:hypothetical protein
MTGKTKKKKEKAPPVVDTAQTDHVLLNHDDWKDPKGRKVISEYHKVTHMDGTEDAETEKNEQPLQNQGTGNKKTSKMPLQHIIDVSTIELMTYTLTRALFHRGVRVPLYMKGVVDMDIELKDTDLIINTNDVAFEPPPLQIWHIIFSYKGKPVFEYGRGIKNTMKIHHGRAFLFLLAMWIGGRKRRKQREKATLKACKELSENPPDKIKKIQKKHSGDQ